MIRTQVRQKQALAVDSLERLQAYSTMQKLPGSADLALSLRGGLPAGSAPPKQ